MPGPDSVRLALAHRLHTTVRGYMLRGILVLVPFGVTAYVLTLCYRLTAGHLLPFLRVHTGDMPEYLVVSLSVVLFVVIVYFIGLTAGFVIGKRIIALTESVLDRIPVVRTIYGASRQAVEILSKEDRGQSVQAAAIVNFPSRTIKAIAFVTGRLNIDGEGVFYRVFVPTTPNPTSGYFEIYHPDDVQYTTLTVEDAAKATMSAGVLTPESFSIVEASNMEFTHPEAPAKTEDQARSRHRWSRRVLLKLRTRLVSGMLILVPVGMTVFISTFIYDLTAGRITPLARWLAGDIPSYVTAFASVALLIALLYLVGYVTTAVVGARLVRLAERLLGRLPVITTVYAATKQIVETLVDAQSGPKFEAPVLVEFPYPGARTIGFVVGKIRKENGVSYVKVFVPTTPNITVGLLQLYELSQVSACSLGLEEAIKMVVSGGLIGPDTVSVSPFASRTESTSEA